MNLVNLIKGKIADFLLWVGCISIIQVAWVCMEIALYGRALSSLEDSIMGTLFAHLLYKTVRQWAEWRADT